MNAYDFIQNTIPICPYCCASCPDVETEGECGEEFQMECGDCGKVFHRRTVVIVKHTTFGDCEANGQMPHQLSKDAICPDVGPFYCLNCKLEFYDWQLPGGKYPRLKDGEFVLVTP